MQDTQRPLAIRALRGARRAPRSLLITLSLALGLTACDGCSHRARAPISYLGPQTEVVLQLPREDLLAQLAETLPKDFAGVMTAEERAGWQETLKARLGFDPTTVEGLKAAGLDPEAPVAAGLAAGGEGALWVIPVSDAGKLQPILDAALQSRFQAEAGAPAAYKGAKIQSYGVSFGTKTVPRAAYAFSDKVLLLGFGEDAAARVKAGLDQDPKAGIAQQAVFQGWVKQLGDDWFLRVIGNKGGAQLAASVSRGARLLGRRGLPDDAVERLLTHVSGFGYSLSASKQALGLRGGLSLDAEGEATLKRWTGGLKEAPAALFAGPPEEAFLTATARLDLLRLRRALLGDKQPGSAPAALHLRVGMKDLKNVRFRQLARSAAAALWGSLATTSVEAFADLPVAKRGARLPPGFPPQLNIPGRMKLQMKQKPAAKMEPARSPLAELADALGGGYFDKDGVSFLATTKAAAAGLRAKATGTDPLKGAPGLDLSLYPARFADGASTLPPGEIPLMFRMMASRGLKALAWVEELHVQVVPKDKELLFTGALKFSDRVKAAK